MRSKYSSSGYSSSRFSGYVREFVVETWERHRPRGINALSSNKYFTNPLPSLPSARLSTYVTEPVSLVDTRIVYT